MSKPFKSLDKDINILETIIDNIDNNIDILENSFNELNELTSIKDKAYFMRFTIFDQLLKIRSYIDQYETVCNSNNYTIPTYSKMLYY